jgi:hypothetical protein
MSRAGSKGVIAGAMAAFAVNRVVEYSQEQVKKLVNRVSNPKDVHGGFSPAGLPDTAGEKSAIEWAFYQP